jgi:hypothetical protein
MVERGKRAHFCSYMKFRAEKSTIFMFALAFDLEWFSKQTDLLITFKPALKHTQPPIQIKQSLHETFLQCPCSRTVKKCGALPPISLSLHNFSNAGTLRQATCSICR